MEYTTYIYPDIENECYTKIHFKILHCKHITMDLNQLLYTRSKSKIFAVGFYLLDKVAKA